MPTVLYLFHYSAVSGNQFLSSRFLLISRAMDLQQKHLDSSPFCGTVSSTCLIPARVCVSSRWCENYAGIWCCLCCCCAGFCGSGNFCAGKVGLCQFCPGYDSGLNRGRILAPPAQFLTNRAA